MLDSVSKPLLLSGSLIGMNAASSLVSPYELLLGVSMLPQYSYLGSSTYIFASPATGSILPSTCPTSTSPVRVRL